MKYVPVHVHKCVIGGTVASKTLPSVRHSKRTNDVALFPVAIIFYYILIIIAQGLFTKSVSLKGGGLGVKEVGALFCYHMLKDNTCLHHKSVTKGRGRSNNFKFSVKFLKNGL